jgi:lysophospholipase L1-like esterase
MITFNRLRIVVASIAAISSALALAQDRLPEGAPFASEINAYIDADAKQMPAQGAVLFIGSSSIRMWTTLAQDFREIPVINRGFGGSFIEHSTLYADRIAIPYKPKIIVICAGTNDLAVGNKSPEQVFEDYKAFVAKIHTALPDTRVVFLAINPTVARWTQESRILETNFLIKRYTIEHAKIEKMSYIDPHSQLMTADNRPRPDLLLADGLHFNALGYKVWRDLIWSPIMGLASLDGVARAK